MFGYVRPFTPELRVREQEYYRAVYCGLCRAQGKCTGCLSRLTLSYDFAFLALLRLALDPERARPTVRARRCALNPFRKRPMMEENEALSFCACAAAMLTYHKCDDDVRDESGAKRLKARLARPFLAPMRRRAARRYPEVDASVASHMAHLSALEAESLPSVDRYATAFGELMADLLAYGLPEPEHTLARTLGLSLGRFLYIIDAYDDLEEDRARGRFNPFLLLYGEAPPEKGSPDNPVTVALLNELQNAANAADLIDPLPGTPLAGLIDNILHLGMPSTVKRVTTPEEPSSHSHSAKESEYDRSL